MESKYCKCKNKYVIYCEKECKEPEYWKQGIGSLTGQGNE